VSLGELASQEGVRSVLVLVALSEQRLDTCLIEGAAHEGAGGRCAHEADASRRLQPQLTEPRGNDIGGRRTPELAEGLGPRDGFLAPRAEAPYRVRQFLGLRERYRGGPELGQQSHDVRVFSAEASRLIRVRSASRRTVHHPFDGMRADVLDDCSGEVQLEQDRTCLGPYPSRTGESSRSDPVRVTAPR